MSLVAARSPALPVESRYAISKLVVLGQAAYFTTRYKNCMTEFADMAHGAMLHMIPATGTGVWNVDGFCVASSWLLTSCDFRIEAV